MCDKNAVNLFTRNGINGKGVYSSRFLKEVQNSDLVFNSPVHWVCFQGSCDFVYLVKGQDLTEVDLESVGLPIFLMTISTHVLNIYDVKGILRYLSDIPSELGLKKLSQVLLFLPPIL